MRARIEAWRIDPALEKSGFASDSRVTLRRRRSELSLRCR